MHMLASLWRLSLPTNNLFPNPSWLRYVVLTTTGEPVAEMVSAFEQRRNYVVQRLRQIPGIKLAEPQVGDIMAAGFNPC